ncbi:Retrovirus-related Pol polyprotein from transposon TNT 1-94 [Gossypium australe]|uniref:Retrovirus-related Pol polyprotein from transposon TNT 1-94 n=1 Tax=Gossypium australe TaxID=47621 RepID=A0A5B6X2R9_9ROSI|nr:Retrovirus-related Pol polyprotein from transposon TNT 1-94 [Gossypium australe]
MVLLPIEKASWLEKGCSQVIGCDFRETFTPVVKPATIHTILSIDVIKRWSLRQVEVNNVFLNGDLTEEVYMQQPPGYVQTYANGKPLVCRLNKTLYGLRQAPGAWFDKLKTFDLSKFDAFLFIRVINQSHMYFIHVPIDIHFMEIKRILRYLDATIDYELHIRLSKRLPLVGYADANWGLDFDDRRSTTRHFVYFDGNLISWCSKKQQVVSWSTAEA